MSTDNLQPGQFHQPELPFAANADEKLSNRVSASRRARYHQERWDQKPLIESPHTQYEPPDPYSSGRSGGGSAQVPRTLSSKAGLRTGMVNIPARNNYPVPEGQRVLNHKTGSPYNYETDRHGNIYDSGINHREVYQGMGPQFSEHNQSQWEKHAVRHTLDATTPLHTIQHSSDTGDHVYIHGPMKDSGSAGFDPDRPSVLVHKGVPILLDGHHRLAESRGRGHASTEVNLLRSEQFESKPVLPHVSRSASPTEVEQHLREHHNFITAEAHGIMNAYRRSPDPNTSPAHFHELMHGVSENHDHTSGTKGASQVKDLLKPMGNV